ncbi:hypothetical protein OOK36_29505 [Streptomyces sp. NBC_00365]|uniref:hypothetical protein n=1 Tax=Streptomyces sp. NBC_00365 TaxID=2975726 RepID=UPI00225A3726|nr:hypothetical protein [Streptomyces sp. NBC_00365]MCX5092949.1 hypothetical protein [Streptomyces sp. NBC_00365]
MKSRRTAARALATGVCAIGLVVGLQGQAWAGTVTIFAPDGAGKGTWNADPDGSTPGDAIRACDTKADGWGIETALDYNYDGVMDRRVDTRGHAAGYCSDWLGGDLKEGRTVRMYVTMVAGSSFGPSVYIDVVA